MLTIALLDYGKQIILIFVLIEHTSNLQHSHTDPPPQRCSSTHPTLKERLQKRSVYEETLATFDA